VTRIDVAICTWNRSALLAQTLERLMQIRVPTEVEWKLLVVNNNSTDATNDVLEAFASRLPLRWVLEPLPGLSSARNRAVSEVLGDYVIWTDDDVLVDPDWIAGYARAFKTWPEAAVFGGPVHPWFDGTPPRWLADHWQRVAIAYAVRQFGDTPFPLDPLRLPFGANFAFRTEVLREYRFDPTLGRGPDSYLSGEETLVIREMLAAGHTGWWVPDAAVQHFIPRDRQSVRYLRRIFIGQGELECRGVTYEPAPELFGHPRWLLRRALAAEARYRWSRLTQAPDVWLDRLIEAAHVWGRVRAAS
jgi:glycosyltransferase involved in cell wall biosynthesis